MRILFFFKYQGKKLRYNIRRIESQTHDFDDLFNKSYNIMNNNNFKYYFTT